MVQKVFAGEVSETILLRRRREADQFSLGDQVDLRTTCHGEITVTVIVASFWRV